MKTLIKHVLLLIVLSAAAYTARAQAPSALPQRPVWQRHAGEQLARVLTSNVPEIRSRGLVQVIRYAQFTPDLDVSATVPALLSIYRSDTRESARIAAVVALQAIGDEVGMQRLYAGLPAQAAPRVQFAALASLKAYYGTAVFEGDAGMAARADRLRNDRMPAAPVIAVLR